MAIKVIIAAMYALITHTYERATPYNPVAAQCQGNPLITADGSHIDTVALRHGTLRWVALSRDQLTRWGGSFDYGDTITIRCASLPWLNGQWVVRDCMNARYVNSIDFLVDKSRNFGVLNDVKLMR
jgi:hypothetical protein